MVATILITIVLAAMVAAIIRYLYREHRKGHCASCPYAKYCTRHRHG